MEFIYGRQSVLVARWSGNTNFEIHDAVPLSGDVE